LLRFALVQSKTVCASQPRSLRNVIQLPFE
jgi:hypothetical protein